jgi:putative heme-binding domain-containing protein
MALGNEVVWFDLQQPLGLLLGGTELTARIRWRAPVDRRFVWVVVAVIGMGNLTPAFADALGQAGLQEYVRYTGTHIGDAGRGRDLFLDLKRLACVRCHRVRGEGGEIGPDLSDVGGKFDRPLLIESVLEPSRQIVDGYRTTTIATVGGQVLTGIVRDETQAGLVIVDAQGKRHAVRAAEIEDRKVDDTSLMPSGVSAGLSPAELTDLVAYLETLRSAGPIALPKGFTWSRVAAGITGATAMEVAPDGRVFVCEQTGALRVVKGDRLLDAPFLTVRVDSTWERGLIGVTLGPDFANNGHVYVTYVAREPYPHHRVSRFTARGDAAVPNSERVLFKGDDQTKLGGTVPAGHQGGAIHFGKDGKLYVAIGEQTAGAPAQAMDTLQGKMLRINADGSIPADNPFYGEARGKYRAIWALGLRNPFTFAVQPGTGRIYINDVGQSAWEEIDEGVAGANFGWPASEGPTTDPRFRAPIHYYPVASIAGGAFCPSDALARVPARYRGQYFFADFVKGWINVLDPEHPEKVETFATGLARPVDLRFAADGSLYVLQRDAWVIDGNFRRATGSLLKIQR